MKKNNKKNRKIRLRKCSSVNGMTMAEMMITIAIIMVLAGVAFIALFSHQKNLAMTERDGYAKEIFIAAQNHLTMVRGEGYLDVKSNIGKKKNGVTINEADVFGIPEMSGTKATGNRYFVVHQGDKLHTDAISVLDLMLPFAALDETVRVGGNYIIRYNPDKGKVLDVFYCSNGTGRYDYTLTENDYTTANSGDNRKVMAYVYDGDGKEIKDNREDRRDHFRDGKLLGWYGGTQAGLVPTYNLLAPKIEVDNGDILKVTVSDIPDEKGKYNTQKEGKFKLILTGETSNIKMALDTTDTDRCKTDVEHQYTFILDDISSAKGLHFCELAGQTNIKDKTLFAGEDIKVEAVAYSNTAFTNIAYSKPAVTNSLYESITAPDPEDTNTATLINSPDLYPEPNIALISSFRHFENLEKTISNTGYEGSAGTVKKITFIGAKQNKDLDRDDYKGAGVTFSGVYAKGSEATMVGGLIPVSSPFTEYTGPGLFNYDGLRHSFSDVTISYTGNAGLFGTISSGTVKNLELKDFNVTADSGNAGALAGSMVSGATVSNIIAYRTEDKVKDNDGDRRTVQIESRGTNAGGLVGSVSGGSSVLYCGASYVVKGGTNAGGLIGYVEGTNDLKEKINACYSGGRTDAGEYRSDDDDLYNVEASTAAGGLIGSCSNASVRNSYSTCSAKATNNNGHDGGLIGSLLSTSVNRCYSTGLVEHDYAFIGNGSASGSKNYYYQSINLNEDVEPAEYKSPTPRKIQDFITALDEDAATFDRFTSDNDSDDDWNDAKPYDKDVKDLYNGKYPFRTVTQLVRGQATKIPSSDSGRGAYFVNTHHGDWPAPEVFLVNIN